MQIKKFQAATLQKALEMVREELGDGAIILQADPVKSGILGRNGVEVTAAQDRKDVTPRFQMTLPAGKDERASDNEVKTSGKWKFLNNIMPKKASKVVASTPVRTSEKEKLTEQVRRMAEKVANGSEPLGVGASAPAASTMGQLYAMKTFIEPMQKQMDEMKKQMATEKGRGPTTSLLESQIYDLKKKLTLFMSEQKFKESELPPAVQQLIQFWKEKGMTDRQIYSFLQKVEDQGLKLDAEVSGQFLEPIISKNFKEAKTLENPKQKIVCLVGSTGVGKTTTIAKMAAFEKLKLGRTVALVTLDDYKIGGTDQLAHYARILEVPFIKLRPDASFEEQLKGLNVDTIFIDTFGVSPKDNVKILELRKQINFRDPILKSRLEVHLALTVGMPASDVDRHMETFSTLTPQFLLFTKWDETDNWGGMLATILAYSIPVSFVGHGQEVPDDLSVFSGKEFARTVTSIEN